MTDQRDTKAATTTPATPANPARNKNPQRFGPYELIRRIGAGGMAEVFLARSIGAEGLEKQLVIKRILPVFAQRQRFISMFIDEAKLAVSLNHPNIVQVYEFGKVGEDYYLAMEHIEGMDLARLLGRMRAQGLGMGLGESIYITLELCKGLDYAHRKTDQYGQPINLVHRDISPHNVLISSEGVVKIVDFGIARARTVGEESENVIRGKFNYMSPEQALGGHLDQRSDLFSAGVLMFELLFHRPLFQFSSRDEALDLVKRAILPDLKQMQPQLPPAVEAILTKSLERIPDRRYESARAMQLDLTRVLFSLPEIHDAQTLAQFLRDIELKLTPEPLEPSLSASGTPANEQVTPAQPPSPSLAASAALTPEPPAAPVPVLSGSLEALQHTSTTERYMRQEGPRREKKTVVCISGDISGFKTLRQQVRPERLQAHLVELMRIVESIAFKNRATVERFSEAGFLLLLGLPASGEDDAERAVWMSLDLIEAMEGININVESPLHVSIGIALGCVMVSHNAEHRDVDRQLLGSIAAMARNLAREAMPREVVVVGRVFQRVRKSFEFELIQKLQHASHGRYGQGHPTVYRLSRPKTRDERLRDLRGSYTVLHGRELELRALRDQFRLIQIERQARGILIEAAMGFGKSALIEEFLRGLEAMADDLMPIVVSDDDEDIPIDQGDAPRLLRVQALSHRADAPYALLADLLQEALALPSLQDLRAVKASIQAAVQTYFPGIDAQEQKYLTHAFGFLFDIKFPESALEALDGNLRRSRLFLSMRRLLERVAATRPLVVFVDDAHLADASSIDFLHDLLDTPPHQPMLLVLSSRPLSEVSSVSMKRLRGLERSPFRALTIQSLRDLSPADAEALIREKIRPLDIEPEAVQHILGWAGGNPYFILELLDALRHRNELEVVDGRLALGTLSSDPWLPSGIEAVVAARIDRLEPSLKLALQQCSVLGEEFEADDATFLFGIDFPERILALCSAGLLMPVRRAGSNSSGDLAALGTSGAYRFVNTLTFGVTFRDVLWEDRKDWHAALADRLIQRAATSTSTNAANPSASTAATQTSALTKLSTIARHLEGAMRDAEAAHYYAQAAQRAIDSSSHPEALRLLNHALRLAGDQLDLAWQTLINKELVLAALKRHDARRDVFPALDDIAERTQTNHPTRLLVAATHRARYLYDIHDIDGALALINTILHPADNTTDTTPNNTPEVQAQALRLKAEITGRAGDAEAAIDLAEQALSLFSTLDLPVEQARVLKILGDLCWQVARYDQSIRAFEQALASPVPLPASLANVLHANLGLALMNSGLYEQGCARFNEALDAARAVGFRQREAGILPNLGYAQHLMGDVSGALATLRRAIRIAREAHNDLAHADALMTLSVVELELDDLDPAARHLERARAIAVQIQSNYLIIHAFLTDAELHLIRAARASSQSPHLDAAIDAAITAAQSALDLGHKFSMGHGIVCGHDLLCRAFVMRGLNTEALSHARLALDHLKQHPLTNREAIFVRLADTLQRLDPEHLKDAEFCLEKAASIVRRIARHLSPDNRRTYLNRPAIHAILDHVPGLSGLLARK